MGNRAKTIIISITIFLISFLMMTPALFAQESESRFKQKLEWKEDPSAYEYKVEIKSVENGNVINYSTTSNSISFSLASGEYQWRVIAYDFLGRVASTSEWKDFSIRKAIAPEIKKAESVVALPKRISEKEISIPVEAEKIQEDAKIVLINEENNTIVEGKIQDEKAVFPKVEPGTWKMKVTNPGGLSSESQDIQIATAKKETKPVEEKEPKEPKEPAEKKDIFLTLGVDYRPIKTYEHYVYEMCSYYTRVQDVNLDVNLKLEYFPFNVKGYKIGIGLEYSPTMFAIPVGMPGYEVLLLYINPLMINAVGLIPLYKENIYCGVKLGAGPNLSLKVWLNDSIFSDTVGFISYGVRSGAFIRFVAGKTFVVDFGLDYAYWNISKEFDNHSVMGYCSLGIRL